MIAAFTLALAGVSDPTVPAPMAITCQLDIVEVGYFGPHGKLKSTAPRRRLLRVNYILDFQRPSLTLDGLGYKVITINDAANGASVLIGPDGMDVEVNTQMTGGFVIRSVSHFKSDGSGGTMSKDTFSQGALVDHEEGSLKCIRHQAQ